MVKVVFLRLKNAQSWQIQQGTTPTDLEDFLFLRLMYWLTRYNCPFSFSLFIFPYHQIDVLLWATRVATILFTVGYILPIFGNPYNSYYKALMASAATSALRLHQRLPQVQFNRQFLGKQNHYFTSPASFG